MLKTPQTFEASCLDDVLKLIKKHYPDGLEAARKTDFFRGGAYIGFNLCRYAYTERMAVELHMARDRYLGCGYYCYGAGPLTPDFSIHVEEDGTEWYELTTG